MYSTIFLFQKSPLSKSLLRCRRSRSSPHTPTRAGRTSRARPASGLLPARVADTDTTMRMLDRPPDTQGSIAHSPSRQPTACQRRAALEANEARVSFESGARLPRALALTWSLIALATTSADATIAARGLLSRRVRRQGEADPLPQPGASPPLLQLPSPPPPPLARQELFSAAAFASAASILSVACFANMVGVSRPPLCPFRLFDCSVFALAPPPGR